MVAILSTGMSLWPSYARSQHEMSSLLPCSTNQIAVATPFPDAILTSKNASQECSCLCVNKCPRWPIGCFRLQLAEFTLPFSFLTIDTPKWWRHGMETLSLLLTLCNRSLVDSHSKRPVMRCLMFSLLLAKISCWVDSQVAGELRRHDDHVTLQWYHVLTYRTQYGATYMLSLTSSAAYWVVPDVSIPKP